MGVQGTVDPRFEPVRACFAEVVRGQAGLAGALENTLRSCLGLPPRPDAIV